MRSRAVLAVLISLSFVASLSAETLTITTLAGSTRGGGYVDAQGTDARFSLPHNAVADAAGNIYVTDRGNHVIRKIDVNRNVTTLAGSAGQAGSSDGTGAAARFYYPAGLAIDKASGTLYVADSWNHTIRKVTPSGVVTTFAGSAGKSGITNGTGSAARFSFPQGLAFNPAGGLLYVADTSNHQIRKITADGVVTKLAGVSVSGSDDGFGDQAEFNAPYDVALDSFGDLYVADANNHTIRKVTAEGRVTTLAGKAEQAGFADGIGQAARFDTPWGVDVDDAGNVWVADRYNDRIRKVTPAGVVTTEAGNGSTNSTDGVGASARFNEPTGITFDNGTLIIADRTNNGIRRMVIATREVVTVAGSMPFATTLNGSGTAAGFRFPYSSVVDAAGNVYTAEVCSIRKTTPQGVVTILAGTATTCGAIDGSGSAARFNNPRGIAIDPNGNLIVADTFNHTLRKVTPAGVVTTIAGVAGVSGWPTNSGVATTEHFAYPYGVAVDNRGTIYIADSDNNLIRTMDAAGVITTFAGQVSGTVYLDGVGTDAHFWFPTGIALDADRNIYVADWNNDVIRKITQSGVVTTLAGNASAQGWADGKGKAALFNGAAAVTADRNGNVYVADTYNDVIRRITPDGTTTTIAGQVRAPGNVDGTGSAARVEHPWGITMHPNGSLVITDTYNHNLRAATFAAPRIASFVATPSHLKTGETTATLSWNVADATTVTIDQNIGTVPAIGSRTVVLTSTATWTLTATGPGGTVTAKVTVTVGDTPKRRATRH